MFTTVFQRWILLILTHFVSTSSIYNCVKLSCRRKEETQIRERYVWCATATVVSTHSVKCRLSKRDRTGISCGRSRSRWIVGERDREKEGKKQHFSTNSYFYLLLEMTLYKSLKPCVHMYIKRKLIEERRSNLLLLLLFLLIFLLLHL